MREYAEGATLSSCGEWKAMDEAVDYRDGVAMDNNVRKEVATDTTSGGAGTLPTPVLETPVAGLRAGVRPRVTDAETGKRRRLMYSRLGRSETR